MIKTNKKTWEMLIQEIKVAFPDDNIKYFNDKRKTFRRIKFCGRDLKLKQRIGQYLIDNGYQNLGCTTSKYANGFYYNGPTVKFILSKEELVKRKYKFKK